MANIFTKAWGWIKDNPFKTVLITLLTAGILTVIFSKKVRAWLGLGIRKAKKAIAAKKQKALAGHKTQKKLAVYYVK